MEQHKCLLEKDFNQRIKEFSEKLDVLIWSQENKTLPMIKKIESCIWGNGKPGILMDLGEIKTKHNALVDIVSDFKGSLWKMATLIISVLAIFTTILLYLFRG